MYVYECARVYLCECMDLYVDAGVRGCGCIYVCMYIYGVYMGCIYICVYVREYMDVSVVCMCMCM